MKHKSQNPFDLLWIERVELVSFKFLWYISGILFVASLLFSLISVGFGWISFLSFLTFPVFLAVVYVISFFVLQSFSNSKLPFLKGLGIFFFLFLSYLFLLELGNLLLSLIPVLKYFVMFVLFVGFLYFLVLSFIHLKNTLKVTFSQIFVSYLLNFLVWVALLSLMFIKLLSFVGRKFI